MAQGKRPQALSPQQRRVLDFLETGRALDPMTALREMGISRLAARVFELKKKGVLIEMETATAKNQFGERCPFALYRLKGYARTPSE
jgi:hypothetical protein